MKQDNLNRVRGILSARQGTQIPKFNPGGKMYVKTLPMNVKVYSKDGSTWFQDENFRTPYDDINSAEFLMAASQEIDVPMAVPGDQNLTPNTAVEVSAEQTKKIEEVLSNEVIQDIAHEKKVNLMNQTQKSNQQDSDEVNTSKPDIFKPNTDNQYGKNEKLGQVGQAFSQGIQVIGNAFGAAQAATDSNTTKNITAVWDGAAQVASQFGPVGEAISSVMGIAKGAGDIMQAITGGTDQITKTDQWMSSPLLSWNIGAINDLFAKNTDSFGVDQNTLSTVGSSYGGAVSQINDAASKAGKKVGLFAGKERRDINTTISNARTNQAKMRGIADAATDQRLAVQSMGEQAGLAYSMMTDGGYNQKYTYAAKHGGLLEWNPVSELEWEPQVELNWELPTFKEGGNIDINEELEWIPEFKDGGKTEESDIPETEETTQKNVIPEGALHKNKHHMEHAEGLTKKGIPVVDEDGEQQAEIEHSEIIFTLEVTKKLEEYYEIFYSEASTNKEKEQAALDAGKLLVYQILENTEDRTGLIESCKKGGSLTLKKSTDDLIEEVLEWIPTIVIVEEQKESKEEEHNKEEDKSEAKNEQSDKDKMKEAIREVLIELLLK